MVLLCAIRRLHTPNNCLLYGLCTVGGITIALLAVVACHRDN